MTKTYKTKKAYNKISFETPYIAVVGGGTGGHIFPAQALAEALQKKGHQILYITDKRGMSFEARPKNIKMFVLDLPRYRFGIMGKIAIATRTLIEIAYVTLKFILNRPRLVVGFGGYPSFPPLMAALVLGIPFMLHEQNAYAGRVTRWLAPFAKKITSVFKNMEGFRQRDQKKIVVTGNPIRKDIIAVRKSVYKAPANTINLFVVGGSQGATIFSTAFPKALGLLPAALRKRLRLTQQCRPKLLKKTEKAYEKYGIKATLSPFFTHMASEYKKAHLIVTRAGASTVTELAVVGRPSLFIPLPTAMNDHQMHNARSLSEKGAGWYLLEKDLTPPALAFLLEEILTDPKKLEKTAEKLHSLGVTTADQAMTDAVESVLGRQ
jgi:UDP-N-acetylglucosamine--N-acetylmuramyl-(pentapeptide) pyrophosphoryl-undecaprenol N-acetylglucosamine transferase